MHVCSPRAVTSHLQDLIIRMYTYVTEVLSRTLLVGLSCTKNQEEMEYSANTSVPAVRPGEGATNPPTRSFPNAQGQVVKLQGQDIVASNMK